MLDLLRRTLGEHITAETVLADSLWTSFVDPNELEHSLLNLAINARDAMPGGGKLTIETSNSHLDDANAAAEHDVDAGEYVVISVVDTGRGMSRAVLESAFDPFFTTKEPGQGTGLGLSQVYGFAKQSGGNCTISSKPGIGTTVRLYLPRHFGPADAIVEKPKPVDTDPERGDTILVVEDDEDVRAFVVGLLSDLGYEVLPASDGKSALQALDMHPEIRLLFTDCALPGGMDGREVAEEARRRHPGLKLLYTTGYTRDAIVRQGRLDPGVELIVKPFSAAVLAEKIRQILGTAASPVVASQANDDPKAALRVPSETLPD
jgi:CheY-like chemotaxis protein